ncbi:MAG: AcrR family transcriptional regulator [Myxococcota bacterium]|jgi:AcrR family transcriptional regulator
MTSRRELQRQETRRRLYESALTVFRRDGYHDCSIEEIARVAGVSRGTFYFHFPTKDAVLEDLFVEAEAEFVEAVITLPETATIEEVLDASATAMARRWSPEPKLWQAVGLVALQSTAQKLAQNQTLGIRQALGQRFQLAAGRGEVSLLVDPQVLSDFYLANAFAVAVSWSTDPSIMPLEQVLRGAAFLFLHGVKAPPAL